MGVVKHFSFGGYKPKNTFEQQLDKLPNTNISWSTMSVLPTGRWVFGQLHPEHLVSPIPTLQRHSSHCPVAAFQCGGKAVPGGRPPLLRRLPASSQEDPSGHPTRNLRECSISVATQVKSRIPRMLTVAYPRNSFQKIYHVITSDFLLMPRSDLLHGLCK